jgi:hypothetical protein
VQPAIVRIVAEQQRADVRPASLRIGPADDDELFAVEALGLNPDPAVAWCIEPIRLLGNGAFKTKFAGLRSEGGAIAGTCSL